jgi:NhaA family Na+:H+ antiporter
VGLEIKRELTAGELASVRRAALPVAAALGGMILPALIYTSLNLAGPGRHGWGVPMATDIAFALGVLALLGRRAPTALKVFLAALAIADDLGAVAVIAAFYSEAIAVPVLMVGVALIGLSAVANVAGARSPWVYVTIGIAVWVAFIESGVHATVAGALLAMTVPARRRIDAEEFVRQGRAALDRFVEQTACTSGDIEAETHAVHELQQVCRAGQTPLQRMEAALHPWASFAIMPIFAFANAGVPIGSVASDVPASIPLGIALGLVLGKPLGITVFSWLAVRLRAAELPAGVSWAHIHGASWLAGIGFTMALFIAGLAFKGSHALDMAKLAVLGASVVAGSAGYILIARLAREETAVRESAT